MTDIFKDYIPGSKVRIVGYSVLSNNAYGRVDEVTKTGLMVSTTPYGGNLSGRSFNFVEVELPVVTHKEIAQMEAASPAMDARIFGTTYANRLLRIVHASDLDMIERGEEDDTPFFAIACPGEISKGEVVFLLDVSLKSWEYRERLHLDLLKLEHHYGLI